MKRILVIGSGGAGKSTFAKRLGEILKIEVLHLDSIYWRPNWTEPAKTEWKQTIEQIIARDSWVMDGNYSGTLDLRLAACDTAIFLDLARTVCLWRVMKRLAKYRNKSRPDMAEGCVERFDLEFVLWVWGYPKRTKPKIIGMLKEHSRDKQVIILKTTAEVENFLAAVKGA